MGVADHEPAKAAKQRLARLLRNWWEQDPGKITQEALARRITERGVRTSQEMLSRYLHRTRPTLARPDVIRVMHQVLGRAPQELETALALHGEASAQPAGRRPSAPQPVTAEAAAPPPAPGRPDAATAPAAVAAPAPRTGPPLATGTPLTTGAPPAAGRPGRLTAALRPRLAAALAALATGACVLTAAVTFGGKDGSGADRPDGQRPAAAAPAPTPSPAAGTPSPPTLTAHCRGESCFGIDPKYAICREDAATYYTGHGHGIRVELRFSPTCQAAWGKMSGTSQGDVVRVTNNAGRSRHYTQQWGHDAHSTMVAALNPDDATACARTPRGEVCATVPAPAGTPAGTPHSAAAGRG
ncbi:hypothetical protein TU94_00715 [Streptomyces cyaneogriseus subsp. noncyanogenus]|uniref:DUF2690 domain-containing protein n=1 Tax=Streptomyces cyaneogriseus subsp. noncyanogenus TaxID=477245 RepID=A0A0C5FWX3_9ACTN|nr:DUF2690 domain-containing protein [Streptomyces cyaneogriseus]AJP00289.1 hypothetical protein TU94_00715 [Streptomyces cyaneogriseus subsp. noncyanogenus]